MAGPSARVRALTEAAALNPMNIYGATKAAADLALGAMASDGLRIIRARPFNHTGPGQTPAFVVSAFARQVARIMTGRQPASLSVGALDPLRDFLDVRDVCACYAACLRQADAIPSGTILNIASGQARRIGDVLDELLAVAGIHAAIEVDPIPPPADRNPTGGRRCDPRPRTCWDGRPPFRGAKPWRTC